MNNLAEAIVKIQQLDSVSTDQKNQLLHLDYKLEEFKKKIEYQSKSTLQSINSFNVELHAIKERLIMVENSGNSLLEKASTMHKDLTKLVGDFHDYTNNTTVQMLIARQNWITGIIGCIFCGIVIKLLLKA